MVQLRRARSIRCLGFAALVFLAGCRDSGSPFPLDPGLRYGYRLHLDSEGTAGSEISKSFAVNLPPLSVDGTRTTPRLFQDGRIIYYAGDASGIRAAALRIPGADVTAAAPDQYFLKYPLRPGTHWRAPAQTVLLTQKFLYSKALPITIGIDLDYTIENPETVNVPAGRFPDCIKVTAVGRTSVTTIDNQGTLEVSVELTDWYAPGIGLVKSIRAERAGEERTGNAKLVTELDYFGTPSWFD